MARLCPLFSGSSGNSYYIGSKSAGVLIDAGRNAKQIDLMLNTCGIDPKSVKGILLTHEHSDHISALRVFAKRHSLPVFSSEGTLMAIGDSLDHSNAYILESELQIAGMTVSHFHTSHDCAEPIGFRIKTADDKIFALATDLGYISEEVENSLLGADTVVIESNHDPEMLRTGMYPYYLKKRILSNQGHISNDTCAQILPKLAKSGTTRFVLAHLSSENNSRRVALQTSLTSLVQAGYVPNSDFLLDAARRENFEGNSIIF